MRKIFSLFLVSCCFSLSWGQVRLPKLIGDGMILQRDADVNIWGWASKEEPIFIDFKGKKYGTSADEYGNWSVTISRLEAGGPYSMEITASNKLELKEIYIGDVWLASGQSNMELTMGGVEPLYSEEITNASNPVIRFFEVPRNYNFNKTQQDLNGGKWEPVKPENIRQFSAVAFFFAKDINERYNIPIGIINSSLGGSPAEAWISEESLKKFPKHYAEAMQYRSADFRDSIQKSDIERIGNWHRKAVQSDKGLMNNWKKENLITSNWHSMKIPGYWSGNELGPENGVLWFRKKIDIPEKLAGESSKLLLGRIVDADSVFVNGIFVGNTTYKYPQRRYTIPATTLKHGKNIISIRITNESGRGGFVQDKPYKLVFPNEEIDLSGVWKYKQGAKMSALRGQTFIRWKPLGLYNAMIAPLTNYTIKGVIWYQGESNTDNPEEYASLFPALIKDWRKQWDQGNFPFLFVQLANFMEVKKEPSESNWARLRESQLKALSVVPKTGMAVAIDVGEWNDIHPLNKKEVGERLAQAAKKVAYHEDVVAGGPVYNSFTRKGDSIIINFKDIGKGLIVKRGKKLKQFAIAGKDRKFVWANAEIKGNRVLVYSPKVKNPVAVRYAWSDNPEGANLFNKDGFPASPFRTDDW